jgi:hypothetical protein
MKVTTVGGLLVLFGLASPAAGQGTRVFPEAKCAYILPGKDWVWLDPKAPEEILSARGAATGMIFNVRLSPATPDDTSGRRDFESFEAEMVASGAVKSLGSRRLEFNGFPSLRMAVVTAKGFHGSLRLVRANGQLYLLSVLRPYAAPSDDEEAEVLKRFVITGQRPSPDELNDGPEEAFLRGRRAGPLMYGFSGAGMVLLIIFGAWVLIRIRG